MELVYPTLFSFETVPKLKTLKIHFQTQQEKVVVTRLELHCSLKFIDNPYTLFVVVLYDVSAVQFLLRNDNKLSLK